MLQRGVILGIGGAILAGLFIVLDKAFLKGVDREGPPPPPVN
jgi:hypothetical protein